MTKRILAWMGALLLTVGAWSQDKFWIIGTDQFRQEINISEVDSCTFSATMFVVRRSNGTRLMVRYANISEITFEEPERMFYKPAEFAYMDFDNPASNWCWERSRQSQHFIVFWEPGFGADPATAPSAYRVDVDDLLEKAEMFFDLYANRLGFIETGSSKTDLYKMQIYLKYQTEWLATGSGYDDVIGALWVNPSTCQPVGHTIGHEIGHSFQYQTSCDNGLTHGFRYGFGDGASGGCAYWESCAQWQGYKAYPELQFTDYRFANYCEATHYHPLHEAPRYDLFFDQDYWCYLHGEDFIGRLWRESIKPEDPIEAYKRLTGIDQEQLNDEMYDRAARFASWDIPALREYGKDYIGAQAVSLKAADEGWWQVDSAHCPQNYGYNIVRLNVPDAGTEVRVQFEGMVGATGYRAVRTVDAGWRYGLVALTAGDERVYGEMQRSAEGQAVLTVPDNCSHLWLVVCGAPQNHWRHPWDDDVTNDEQWPYRVKFEQTAPYGEYDFPDDYQRSKLTLTYDVKLPYSASTYGFVRFALPDVSPVCQALGLTADELKTRLGSGLDFVGVYASGTVTTTQTANGYGHWFSLTGNVTTYSDASARLYSEYQSDAFAFNIGQYPGRCPVGSKYTIRQGLRYKASDGRYYQVTFVFNVTMV